MRNSKGITLIALVITIIVLIILAAVAINLTLGENGILSRAETAKLKYEIAQAEEELDIKIAELQVEKQGSATLQDLVDVLKNEEDMDYIVLLEEIASITGVETIGDVDEIYVVYKIYQFRVDNQLQTEFISIVESYTADVQISSTLKSHDGKNEDEKYTATYEIKVESEGQVQSIEIETIDGKVTETPTSLPYTKEIQVEIGQKYIVKVTTPDGKYKRYLVEEKAEETIKTAQELATFRDKVNSGFTYEGKIVTLANDINLSSVCGTNVNGQEVSWEPIGTATTPFKGTFDGNYNTINSLYMNSNEYQYAGLFGNNNGTIRKLMLEDIYIYNFISMTNSASGGIVGNNNGVVKKCGINSGIISTYNKTGTRTYSGGIVGFTSGNISVVNACYNKADIFSESIYNSTSNQVFAAGIIGGDGGIGILENCYNLGEISAKSYHEVKAGGIIGRVYQNFGGQEQSIIRNSYNVGNVDGVSSTGTSIRYVTIGGILGHDGWDTSTCGNIVTNTYYKQNMAQYSYYKGNWSSPTGIQTGVVSDDATLKGYASTLGDAFIADGKIKNKNGEWEDNVDSQGNIIYINDGYPILKWQIGE